MTGPLDQPLTVTIFPNASASTKAEVASSLREFADRIRNTTAKSKGSLPWLKCAAFGDLRSPKFSLRHNSNVLQITAVEGDYDGEAVSFESACALLRGAGLAALVYTSPSHTAAKPRYRVVCPLSRPFEPGDRAPLLARANGALGGILSPESFTLSQSYYFGSVDSNPAHTVALIDGRFVDHADDLDARATYPARQSLASIALPPLSPGQPPDAQAHAALAAAVELFSDRVTGRHQILLAATRHVAPFILSGHLDTENVSTAITEAMTDSGREPNDGEVESALAGALRKARAYEPPTGGAEFTAFPLAPVVTRLRLLSPDDCEAADGRRYIIKGLIAESDLVCLFGAPGTGKSVVAPHLGYAVAQGRKAFGRRTHAGAVLYVAAEDSHGMRQRIRALKAAHGNAPGFAVVEGVSNLLDDAEAADLRCIVAERRPALVIIDTVAMAYPGIDENTSQDMGRVVAMARSLAAQGAAVVLIHHDTKAADGTPRGHSLLNGALDVSLLLGKADDTGVIRGKLVKNRNGACDATIAFRINSAPIGIDDDGDTITAPVAFELTDVPPRTDRLPRAAAAALSALRELLTDAHAVPESAWRDRCDELRVSTSEDRKSRTTAFRRAYAELRDRGIVVPNGDMVSIVRTNTASEFDTVDPATRATNGDIVAFVSSAKCGGDGDKGYNPLRGCSLSPSAMPQQDSVLLGLLE